ncbi:MAG TPA: protein-glutamate O-methyltransferase CheR [Lachnospiraceae bacterium]|nr:protein-glutamate O-methyltransferase CheR [Lachnospiraceae bacterium]
MIELNDAEFSKMYPYIRSHYGINLEKKKYLIESKLWIELARSKSGSYAEYWKKLQNDETGAMERRMMDLLTTNYTFFCREEQHFDFIRRIIVPALPSNRIRPLRIFSAGCATGQECYTLAMELLDLRRAGKLQIPFYILGTDLSETAIAAAQRGFYNSADYARLPQAWQSAYCEEFHDGQFKVRELLHSFVSFKRQNLLEMPPIAPTYDIIFCRNVLIYFEDGERENLIKKLSGALQKGGYLMIGHTESLITIPNHLKYIQPAVYQKPEVRT